ncbi:MAG: transporter permease, partial [Microbacterium sp.]|nr:transporter permease [Microbacterium sp.]
MSAGTPVGPSVTGAIALPATDAGRPGRRRGHATLVIGLVLTAAVVLVALVSVFWLPYPLSDTSGGRLESPNPAHPLGTDRLGRDLLAQLMVGARIALAVGAGSV